MMKFLTEEVAKILSEDPWCRQKGEAVDFLKTLLVYPQSNRLSWGDIEEHPWIKEEWNKMGCGQSGVSGFKHFQPGNSYSLVKTSPHFTTSKVAMFLKSSGLSRMN